MDIWTKTTQKLHLYYLFVALSVIVLQSPAKATNLITNGSFSSTSLTSSGQAFTYSNGAFNSNITGWSASSGNGSNSIALLYFAGTQASAVADQFGSFTMAQGVTHTIPNSSPDGGNFLTVDGNSNYNLALYQTVTNLTSGATYALSFYQAAGQQSGYTGANSDYWSVYFSDGTRTAQQNSAFMNTSSTDFQPWNQQFMTFTATAVTETLAFLAVSQPNAAPPMLFLDGVNLSAVTATPEPASFAIGGLGLAGLLTLRQLKVRRQTKQRS